MKKGFEHVSRDTKGVAFTDVELPYGLSKIGEAVAYLECTKEVDVIIGDRTKNMSSQYSFYRRFFRNIFRLFIPGAVRHIADTQCGIKIFRTPAAQHILSRTKTDHWVADIEMLLIALRHGLRCIRCR